MRFIRFKGQLFKATIGNYNTRLWFPGDRFKVVPAFSVSQIIRFTLQEESIHYNILINPDMYFL